MKLYSHNQAYPRMLPNRIVLSDGRSRTDSSSFSEQEIIDAGYVLAPTPPPVNYPDKLDWNGIDWVVRSPNVNEIAARKAEIQRYCQIKLQETDYKIIKAVEAGVSPEQPYVLYRQALRELYNSVDYINIWNITYPQLSDYETQEN